MTPKPHDDLRGFYPVTPEHRAFIHRRIGGLTHWSEVSTRPLLDLLANAYAIGMADAAETLSIRAAKEGQG